MAGDPSIERTEKLVYEIEKADADIIELGIPFSDSIADGRPSRRRRSEH